MADQVYYGKVDGVHIYKAGVFFAITELDKETSEPTGNNKVFYVPDGQHLDTEKLATLLSARAEKGNVTVWYNNDGKNNVITGVKW